MTRKAKEAYDMMLLGQRIAVKTHLSPDEMKDLVVLIESQFNQVKTQASGQVPQQKLHLLAMLSIAEKYIALRTRSEKFRKEVVGELRSLKTYIERYNRQSLHESASVVLEPDPVPEDPRPKPLSSGTNEKHTASRSRKQPLTERSM
jgi:hypothetical protein